MAVHVLAVLAHKEGDPVTSAFLAGSVNTNPVVIRRLLLALQKAKLVETRKGAGFGSRLSRSPASINLSEVFRAVEHQKPFTLPPGKPDPECPVGQCIQEALEKVFSSAREALQRELAQTNLAHVLAVVRQTCGRLDRGRL